MKRPNLGFTIVELLIVIVIISILATISVVAYTGIQARAKNAQLLANIDTYTNALQLYKAQNGGYPAVSAAESGIINEACFGSTTSFPADSTFAAGNCLISPLGNLKTSSTFNSQLATAITGLPDMVLPTAASSDNTTKIRGILYITDNTSQSIAYLEYITSGDQDCGRGTKQYDNPAYPGMTVCIVSLQ